MDGETLPHTEADGDRNFDDALVGPVATEDDCKTMLRNLQAPRYVRCTEGFGRNDSLTNSMLPCPVDKQYMHKSSAEQRDRICKDVRAWLPMHLDASETPRPPDANTSVGNVSPPAAVLEEDHILLILQFLVQSLGSAEWRRDAADLATS